MNENIEELEFTIFDTETTGLNPFSGDRIVELAGLRVKGQRRLAEFDVLVNPGRLISPGAFAVNKITPEMLQGAPGIETVIPKFLEFVQGSCLCSYNAEFDLGFLNHELQLLGAGPLTGLAVFDVLTMAKKLLPGLPRYPLWFVAEKLEINLKQKHRAFADVEMTWEVFSRLKVICRQKGITGFTDFSNLFAYNPALLESSNIEKTVLINKYIRSGSVLKFNYISSHNGEISQREVIPQEIRQDNKYKYLVGYCCLKKEQRIFRLDNILNLKACE
ncbi:MAG TPA: exonuclease domain-containing protein [Candidatus Omnitrophota bacterium]|nr:exonuclease domain-containing protein [Candidatus Omnitrophota bacterium]